MPPGIPKDRQNRRLAYPIGRNPPANWAGEISNFPQTRHAFNNDEGAILPDNFGGCTAYKVFRLMWSDDMDETVLKRTNRRGVLNLDQTTLHRFLLAGLMMCVNSRADYMLHWSQDSLYENIEVKKLISRNEFRSILRHSHPKPQRLVHLANKNFKRYWRPYSHVSVDEGLICFKGRFQHRVHIRGKPDATGLKIYGLADEKSYLHAFKLYEGQHETVHEIVEELVDELPSSHYKVYADSWYGSDSLAFLLLQKGFYFTLACGKNRPSEVFGDYLDVGLAKGQCRYLQSKQDPSLIGLSHHDRAKCHFLTNMQLPRMTENHKFESIPATVDDYRQYMGLMDRIDRGALKAAWPHRNKRWTLAFFWHLFGLCVSNAHKIYNDISPGHVSLSMFIHFLIVEWRKLLGKNWSATHRPRNKLILSTSLSRCEVCKHLGRNIAKTKLLCMSCNVHLHPQCFPEYHKQT
jgi:hypothetical protein